LAAGLPVVASRIGQVAEAIRDGRTVSSSRATQGASRKRSALAADLRCARAWSGSRRRVLAERTWSAVAERILLLAVEAWDRRDGNAARESA
jgi:glycosyltransferase involved in cell wall biosynthesis